MLVKCVSSPVRSASSQRSLLMLTAPWLRRSGETCGLQRSRLKPCGFSWWQLGTRQLVCGVAAQRSKASLPIAATRPPVPSGDLVSWRLRLQRHKPPDHGLLARLQWHEQMKQLLVRRWPSCSASVQRELRRSIVSRPPALKSRRRCGRRRPPCSRPDAAHSHPRRMGKCVQQSWRRSRGHFMQNSNPRRRCTQSRWLDMRRARLRTQSCEAVLGDSSGSWRTVCAWRRKCRQRLRQLSAVQSCRPRSCENRNSRRETWLKKHMLAAAASKSCALS
mmetsp:Transcript_118955/g.206553  ORF Transcript_118955/g.206553 Transcript_118955/m.206553 type:complete len:276 (-) Transcript_118955:116-943(-)